ncbi:MAG: hypothetical protein AAGE05_04280 [Pseudomonadota bacterium]
MLKLSYPEAIEKADHLKALGETTLYLRDDEGFPYGRVVSVEPGSSYRLNGPTSCWLVAEDQGLTFRLSIEFEPYSANGSNVSQFDRKRLRDIMLKLPGPARIAFADMLADKVLPEIAKRTADLRKSLNTQADTEECVRSLIRAAAEKEAA